MIKTGYTEKNNGLSMDKIGIRCLLRVKKEKQEEEGGKGKKKWFRVECVF